jgi:hypothetical protein
MQPGRLLMAVDFTQEYIFIRQFMLSRTVDIQQAQAWTFYLITHHKVL